MFYKVAIIVCAVSLVHCQPLHDDATSAEGHVTFGKDPDDEMKIKIDSSTAISEVSIDSLENHETEKSSDDRSLDLFAFDKATSMENTREKRELMSSMAITAMLVSVWSAVALQYMSLHPYSSQPQLLRRYIDKTNKRRRFTTMNPLEE